MSNPPIINLDRLPEPGGVVDTVMQFLRGFRRFYHSCFRRMSSDRGVSSEILLIVCQGAVSPVSILFDMPRIRVLLVDDHEVVRHGLKSLLDAQAEMEVVGENQSPNRQCTVSRGRDRTQLREQDPLQAGRFKPGQSRGLCRETQHSAGDR